MNTIRGRWGWHLAHIALRAGYRWLYYRLAIVAVESENHWRAERGWQPIYISAESRAKAEARQ